SGVSLPAIAPSSRGSVHCVVRGSDIKALVAELDPRLHTALPRRWLFSTDGKTASTRLFYGGGPSGYDANLRVDAREGELSISIVGAPIAVDLAGNAVMAQFPVSEGKGASCAV